MDEISVNSHLKATKPNLQLDDLQFHKVNNTDLEKAESQEIKQIGFFKKASSYFSSSNLYFSTGTHIYKFNKTRGFKKQIIEIKELEKDNIDVMTALIATNHITRLKDDVNTSKINQIDIHHLNFGIYHRKIYSSKHFKITDDFLGIKEDGNKICLYSSKSANKFCFSQSGSRKSHNYLNKIFKSKKGNFAHSNATQGSYAYIWEERAKITEHYPDPKNNTLDDCFKFLKSLADASSKIETNSLKDKSTELTFTFDDETERKLNFAKFFTENLKPDQFKSYESSIEKLKNWSPDQSIPGGLSYEFIAFLTQFNNRFNGKKASSSTSTEVKYTYRDRAGLHFIPYIEVDTNTRKTEIKDINTKLLPTPILITEVDTNTHKTEINVTNTERLPTPIPLSNGNSSTPVILTTPVISNIKPNHVSNSSLIAPPYEEVVGINSPGTQNNIFRSELSSSSNLTSDSNKDNDLFEDFIGQVQNLREILLENFQEGVENFQKSYSYFIDKLPHYWEGFFSTPPAHSTPTPYYSQTPPTQYPPSPPQKPESRLARDISQKQRLREKEWYLRECQQLPNIRSQVPTTSHSFPRENPYSDRPIIQPGPVLQFQPPNIQTLHPQPTYAQAPVFPTSYTLHQAPVFPTLNTLHQAQVPQNLYTTPAQQFPTPYVQVPFPPTPYVQAPFVLNSHAPTPQLPTPYVHAQFLPTAYAPVLPVANLDHQQNSMPYTTHWIQTYPQFPPNPQTRPHHTTGYIPYENRIYILNEAHRISRTSNNNFVGSA